MEVKKTITSIFMVPTLKIPKDALKDNGFINGYVKDEGRDTEYSDAIYLLFKPANVDKFREFLDNEYERTKAIIEDYDYEGGYVVVIYKLDDQYDSDFKLIRQGVYSQTSKSFQQLFPKSVQIIKQGLRRDEISLQYRVFNRTKDLIDFWEERLGVNFSPTQEVWSGFDEENEILNLKKVTENV